VLNILPKGTKFNQLYFADYVFPDLERESMNFHLGISQATVWRHMDSLIYHNGSKATSKSEKHHVSQLSHPPDSPDISSCDFWLFGMLKGVLNNHEFNSSDEIEEAITKVWDGLAFDEVQSLFHNRMHGSLRTRESIGCSTQV
jgi:hypothetical protein